MMKNKIYRTVACIADVGKCNPKLCDATLDN